MSTARLKSRRRQDQGSKWARIAIAVLSTVGIIDTGSITLSRWGILGALSCPGGNNGCNQVLNSPWGKLFDINGLEIPLSFLGLITYLAILAMALMPLIPGISENKNNLIRPTWWGIFTISCSMAIFSLILMGLMVYKIQAFCLFCLLSAMISIALVILSIFGGGWEDTSKLIFRGILISLGILLGGLIWASGTDPSQKTLASSKGIPPIVERQSNSYQIDLAKHLTKSGVKMYSAYWCPHCHDQKELFGKQAVKELVIIECAADGLNNQRSLCEEKNITGFPSWEINGNVDSGVRTLSELSKLTKFNN